ncbi:unnamed protein product [Ilex paraguariensis]|uniref:Uncharacterized protein n=1 Tax=Ilex paraguariensis TaxID=185542 RepID=A0ABC8U351_9AQUA
MAVCTSSTHLSSTSFHFRNPRTRLSLRHVYFNFSSSSDESPKPSFRISADSAPSSPKARFVARRRESVRVPVGKRPLLEYMSLPASQYSVLDAERIERVDDSTFRCYVYKLKFFAFEVCPVLLVRVEEQPNGCCIKLLSCKLEGSPIVVAQNDKFDANGYLPHDTLCNKGILLQLLINRRTFALLLVMLNSGQQLDIAATSHKPEDICVASSDAKQWTAAVEFDGNNYYRSFFAGPIIAFMVNRISCDSKQSTSPVQQLSSDAVIEVNIEIPFAFRAIPVQAIESTGTQVLEQTLKFMLPRFMSQENTWFSHFPTMKSKEGLLVRLCSVAFCISPLNQLEIVDENDFYFQHVKLAFVSLHFEKKMKLNSQAKLASISCENDGLKKVILQEGNAAKLCRKLPGRKICLLEEESIRGLCKETPRKQKIDEAGFPFGSSVDRDKVKRFTHELVKDYQAWASGDTSRQPLGTGGI